MANTKTAANKTTAKASTKKKSGKAKNTAEPMTQPPPIRRELAAVVFLFLGVFCILSYFNTDGSFVAFFSNLIKGLLGWGFWLTAPAFLLVAFILGFHRGRPVAFRVFSALMLPVIFAAVGNLLFYKINVGAFDLPTVTGTLFMQG
ncbi:MAG: DNA translocase FtsK, partial [Eubacteriales bacterium]|nr:DNA translocase FtsK [Eubacteriales bacterium]